MKRASAASNPVLIGAVTVLVTTVAVFLAYNANQGLPFVPTTTVKVRVANGANLVKGNEVRSGGSRIGVVTDMKPVRLEDGSTGAELTLELDKAHGDLPTDSTLRIRPRSALGLKYVEIEKGTSKENFASGDTVPSSQASFATELDEVYEMFDTPPRRTCAGSVTRSPGAARPSGARSRSCPSSCSRSSPSCPPSPSRRPTSTAS